MDLRLVLNRKGLHYQQSPSDPNEIRINCLWCVERGTTQDFRQRLGVNIATGTAHCFNCGFKSRKVIPYLVKRLDLGVVDLIIPQETETEKVRLPEDFESLIGDQTSKDGRDAKRYLMSRGITEKQIISKNIGFCITGRYRYRIVFPVYSPVDNLESWGKKRRLVGIVARSFVGKEPRYLNSTGEKAVYNLPHESVRYEYCVHRGIRQILVISEGILKCLAIERALPTVHSVALFGHSMTERQEELIIPDRWNEIVLFPDPDMQGTKGFQKIAERLSLKAGFGEGYMNLSVVWPPPDRQADDMGQEEIKTCYTNRRPYTSRLALLWKRQAMELSNVD